MATKKSPATRSRKKPSAAATRQSTYDSFMVIVFTALSFAFLLMAIWKYWLE